MSIKPEFKNYEKEVDKFLENLNSVKTSSETSEQERKAQAYIKHFELTPETFYKQIETEKNKYDLQSSGSQSIQTNRQIINKYLSFLHDSEKKGLENHATLQILIIKTNSTQPNNYTVTPSTIENALLESDIYLRQIFHPLDLSKFRDLNVNTFIFKGLSNELRTKDMTNKALLGRSYKDEKNSFNIEVYTKHAEATNLAELIEKNEFVIPVIELTEINNPQKYARELNKKYPSINKIITTKEHTNPTLCINMKKNSDGSLFMHYSFASFR